MNRADVEMLNHQLDELGNSFLRNRQLKEEKQHGDEELKSQQMRTQADIDFRKAQGEHYNAMESKEDNRNSLLEKQGSERNTLLEKQIGLKQSAQDMAEAQSSLKESVATLAHQVKSGKMTQESATQYFKDSMDNGIGKSNPTLHDQMLSQPQYKAMYDGNVDWATIADQEAQKTNGRTGTGKTELQIQHWNEAQGDADQETDPAAKASKQAYADQLKNNLPASLKQLAPATPPGYTDTRITQKPGFGGKPVSTTNTVDRVYKPSGGAPLTPAPMPTKTIVPGPSGAAQPMDSAWKTSAPSLADELTRAQQAITAGKDPVAVKTRFKQRTGQDFDQVTAPQQQVPGFGAAQP